jgi:hypothetical protein
MCVVSNGRQTVHLRKEKKNTSVTYLSNGARSDSRGPIVDVDSVVVVVEGGSRRLTDGRGETSFTSAQNAELDWTEKGNVRWSVAI